MGNRVFAKHFRQLALKRSLSKSYIGFSLYLVICLIIINFARHLMQKAVNVKVSLGKSYFDFVLPSGFCAHDSAPHTSHFSTSFYPYGIKKEGDEELC